jgi:hypothetical protein
MFLLPVNIYCTVQQIVAPMSPMYEPGLMFCPYPLKGDLESYYYLTCFLLNVILLYVTVLLYYYHCLLRRIYPSKLKRRWTLVYFVILLGFRPHLPPSSPSGEEAVLYYYYLHYNYHINFCTRLFTYQPRRLLSNLLSKRGLCSDGLLVQEKVWMRLNPSPIRNSPHLPPAPL